MKHTKKLITLAVAAVMTIGTVSFASCGEEEKKGSTNTGSGTAIVKDTALEGKLFAAYTFDSLNGTAVTAINPFTGAALSDEGKYDLTPATESAQYSSDHAKSGSAYISGSDSSGLKLPWVESLFNANDVGFSFSYWVWSDTSNSDWNHLLDSDYQDITYGNLENKDGGYPGSPDIEHSIGRGAYSDEDYANAQNALSDVQLAVFNSYAGYNAALFEDGNTEKPGSLTLADEMNGTAQYMTVVVTAGESINFYRNGALSYSYVSVDGSDWFCTSVTDGDGNTENKVKAFIGACGYVDDVIIGSGLTDEEVLALYNDQMGASKTMDDVTLKSNLDPDTAVKSEAAEAATANAVAAYKEAAASKVADVVESTAGIAVLGSTDLSDGWGTNYVNVSPDATDSFDVTFTGILVTDGEKNWNSLLTVVASSAGQEFILRTDNYGWVGGAGTAAYTQNSSTYNWDTFLVDVNGAEISVNFKYDGTKVDVLYTVKPALAGQTFTGTSDVTLSDGSTYTATAEFTVPETYTCSYTVTGLSVADGSIFPSFTVEKSYFIITSVEGGSIIADAE